MQNSITQASIPTNGAQVSRMRTSRRCRSRIHRCRPQSSSGQYMRILFLYFSAAHLTLLLLSERDRVAHQNCTTLYVWCSFAAKIRRIESRDRRRRTLSWQAAGCLWAAGAQRQSCALRRQRLKPKLNSWWRACSLVCQTGGASPTTKFSSVRVHC